MIINSIIHQDDDTWWAIIDGYTLGPFNSEHEAEKVREEILSKRQGCATGSCEE